MLQTMWYIYRLIHGHFHIGLVIIPRAPYWPETESRDDNQANMEMPMYQTIYYILPTSRKETPILARANMGLDMEMIL